MKRWRVLLLGFSLVGLAMPQVRAGDEAFPAIPQGYDLLTLSRAPSRATPGLEPLKDKVEPATMLSVVPATGGDANTRIEWSGRITTSVVYKNISHKRN